MGVITNLAKDSNGNLRLALNSTALGPGNPWVVDTASDSEELNAPRTIADATAQSDQAIAAHDERFWGLRYDPADEVLVTAGATEAIAATMLALVEPGDEVIAFEPYYDSYAANIAMAGGVRVPVTLRPPDFRPDVDELAKAVTMRTRLILLNSPHNPTGSVFTRGELAAIASLAARTGSG